MTWDTIQDWLLTNGRCDGCVLHTRIPMGTEGATSYCDAGECGARTQEDCGRVAVYHEALEKAVAKAPIEAILQDEWERFVPFLAEIVREKQVDRAYDVMAEFDRAAREYAEATL